jgi:hypothetical protein
MQTSLAFQRPTIILAVPTPREGVSIGILILACSEARRFSDKQIEMATTFSDQTAGEGNWTWPIHYPRHHRGAQ